MLVLGIESTCDETACALVENGKTILTHVVAEQDHTAYGGVFPEMASRGHEAALVSTIDKALEGRRPDLIAAAHGPGLIGSIVMGLSAAKALSLAWDTPLIGVNHVEAHLYAAMMSTNTYTFPSLGLVISGGHTFMVRIEAIGRYRMLGTTVDDAVGEAFDKVASMLGLPYPGGPHIERLAREGTPSLPFRAGRVKGSPLAFSYSGLKTRVLYSLDEKKEDIAASFQKAVIDDLTGKVAEALGDAQAIYLGGGVACNGAIRAAFQENFSVPVYWPEKALCLDNGAMIAGLGYHKFLERGGDPLDLEPFPRIRSAHYF